MYNGAQAYQTYQQNQVHTVSQEKLVTMLYDGAIRFLNQSATACRDRKVEETNYFLLKAEAIVAELMENVNRDAGEIGESLFLLYEYMHRRLIKANLKKDAAIISEVTEMLSELRRVWVEATAKNQSHNYASPEVNIKR